MARVGNGSQSIEEAKLSGLILNPIGMSGKVVWQSVSPGQYINNTITFREMVI